MTTKYEEELITGAAYLLAGGHSDSAVDMLRGAISEVQLHHHGAGAKAYDNWIAALEMLGQTCISIAKMARNKTKGL